MGTRWGLGEICRVKKIKTGATTLVLFIDREGAKKQNKRPTAGLLLLPPTEGAITCGYATCMIMHHTGHHRIPLRCRQDRCKSSEASAFLMQCTY